jgi:hypothetical protein
MLRLTKQEREERVLDLYYNQNKTYREIAELERMCPRDIGAIVNKESKDIEAKQSLSKAAQAYRMFSEGKSPMEVAIALDLREPEVTQLYKESWNLKQIHELNLIYLETGGNIAPIMKLYRLSKAAGMDSQCVTRVLAIANDDLPSIENRYNNLTKEVNSLEEQKRNSDRKMVELDNQITELSNYIEHYKALCRQEEMKLESLRQLVRQFENSNSEYVKIRQTAEERVRAALSDHKRILKLALLSLTESMKKCPENYISMICYDTRITDYGRRYHPSYSYGFYTYGQRQYESQNYDREDYMAMLVEEADKLHHMLVKEFVDETISYLALPR